MTNDEGKKLKKQQQKDENLLRIVIYGTIFNWTLY